jgi:hypothetical protein
VRSKNADTGNIRYVIFRKKLITVYRGFDLLLVFESKFGHSWVSWEFWGAPRLSSNYIENHKTWEKRIRRRMYVIYIFSTVSVRNNFPSDAYCRVTLIVRAFCVKCPSSLVVELSWWGRRHRIIRVIFRECGMRENIAKTTTLFGAFLSVMFSFTCSVGNVLQFCRFSS